MIITPIKGPTYPALFFSAKMTVTIVTIRCYYEEGQLRVAIKIQCGGYEGSFLLNRDGDVLQAIQIYNPP